MGKVIMETPTEPMPEPTEPAEPDGGDDGDGDEDEDTASRYDGGDIPTE